MTLDRSSIKVLEKIFDDYIEPIGQPVVQFSCDLHDNTVWTKSREIKDFAEEILICLDSPDPYHVTLAYKKIHNQLVTGVSKNLLILIFLYKTSMLHVTMLTDYDREKFVETFWEMLERNSRAHSQTS